MKHFLYPLKKRSHRVNNWPVYFEKKIGVKFCLSLIFYKAFDPFYAFTCGYQHKRVCGPLKLY